VLRPDGVAAFVAWGTPDQPLFRSTLRALGDGAPEPAKPATAPAGPFTPFRFARPGSLRAALQAAGFARVDETTAVFPWPWPGPAAEMWCALRELAGPSLEERIADRSPDAQTALHRRVVENLEAFARDGVVDPGATLNGAFGFAGRPAQGWSSSARDPFSFR
jgi:hypothetical protein